MNGKMNDWEWVVRTAEVGNARASLQRLSIQHQEELEVSRAILLVDELLEKEEKQLADEMPQKLKESKKELN